MSSEVYVGPHTEIDYQIDTDEFISALMEEWNDVNLFPTRTPEYLSLEWEMKIGEYVLSCSLDKKKQTLSLDGATLDEYAPVAVWFRRFLPDHLEIFLTETDGECDVLLTRFTTAQQVIDECT